MDKRTAETAGQFPVNRLYKARLFEMIFGENKAELLKLYNGINGTHYEDPGLLEINTLHNAIYLSMRNDISFIIDMRLNLYEHQSTLNPNLPLRYLLYVSDIYSAYTKDMNLYSSRAIQIPTPRFVIFYNGTKEQPDVREMKLSDLFTIPEDSPALELRAVMLNINRGHNAKLMETCQTLRDYAEYVERIRTYTKEMSLEAAVERTITECIQENILADFLRQNRLEAKKVSIYEYDDEKLKKIYREDGIAEGRESGLAEGREAERKNSIQLIIRLNKSHLVSREDTCKDLQKSFSLSPGEAESYLKQYWTE